MEGWREGKKTFWVRIFSWAEAGIRNAEEGTSTRLFSPLFKKNIIKEIMIWNRSREVLDLLAM